VDPPAQKFVDNSASDEVTREQPIGQSQIALNLPSLRNAVSPSPPPTPQTPSQKNYRSDPISPENYGGSAETGESQNEIPDASPREMLQHPPPDADDNHSESDPVSSENRDWSVRMDEGPNATSHAGPAATLQDHPARADYDYSGSRTDLRDTLSSGNVSRVDVSDKESGELSVREFFVVAKTSIGSDLNRDSDDDDEGTSGTSHISPLTTCTLHGRRLSSKCR